MSKEARRTTRKQPIVGMLSDGSQVHYRSINEAVVRTTCPQSAVRKSLKNGVRIPAAAAGKNWIFRYAVPGEGPEAGPQRRVDLPPKQCKAIVVPADPAAVPFPSHILVGDTPIGCGGGPAKPSDKLRAAAVPPRPIDQTIDELLIQMRELLSLINGLCRFAGRTPPLFSESGVGNG